MVDLPAPFSPTRAWISPFAISIVPSARATTGPKVLTAPCRAECQGRILLGSRYLGFHHGSALSV